MKYSRALKHQEHPSIIQPVIFPFLGLPSISFRLFAYKKLLPDAIANVAPVHTAKLKTWYFTPTRPADGLSKIKGDVYQSGIKTAPIQFRYRLSFYVEI